ncbi:acyl-CoA carboxylase epsilon subunit [Streptomyces sp. NPDC057456]|uniref:acyl-CoA carboxylase epsilon subunit n=1 Tax=Streptomyces sp. NPDC057456 TaxID=3346139 RepID=UPI0036CBD4EE
MGSEVVRDAVVRVRGGGVTEAEVAAVVAVVASLLAARSADVDEGPVRDAPEWRGLGGGSGYRSPRSWR